MVYKAYKELYNASERYYSRVVDKQENTLFAWGISHPPNPLAPSGGAPPGVPFPLRVSSVRSSPAFQKYHK